jgi:hypothetical protein
VNAPWVIGEGVFCFNIDFSNRHDGAVFQFSSNDDEEVMIPAFRHDGYMVYEAQAVISVGDFKMVVANEVELEDTPYSRRCISNEGYFDANYAGNEEHYFYWRGQVPTHRCDGGNI